NRPAYDIALVAEGMQSTSPTLPEIAQILGLSREEIDTQWRRARARPFEPYVIASDVPWETVARVQSNRPRLPGVEVLVTPRRDYPQGSLFAHTLGYMAMINERDLREGSPLVPYPAGAMVGRAGLERIWEDELRGIDGGAQVEVDALQRILRELSRVEPQPGHSLRVTLDLDLQRSAAEAMEGQRGAAVAIDPRNGEILAMVSAPSYDPGAFVRGLTPQEWAALVNDPGKPLDNKAIRGQYPPGSVFKIVTALAGLREHVTDARRTVYCAGALHFADRRFGCWRRGGHGTVALHKALVSSCDVYFYTIGLEVGVNAIADVARSLGLGQATGIDLLGERSGLIPTREWKRGHLNEPWYDGETLPVSIGQGFVLTTPLQLALMTSAVANGGTVYSPHIVREVVDASGETIRRIVPKVVGRLEASPGDLRLVQDALKGVVNEVGGTGARARLPGIVVAGKTGTSQVISNRPRDESDRVRPEKEEIPLNERDHAWFVAYAPVENPEIAVAVLVEHGGGGGSVAAPIAQKILARHFGVDLTASADAP
ncbi:MAG: penicillin-binding protein 2, partial [Myxococcales bacterium]|nr:penicillin-binding protein 2 [Myxococcales bacterium]